VRDFEIEDVDGYLLLFRPCSIMPANSSRVPPCQVGGLKKQSRLLSIGCYDPLPCRRPHRSAALGTGTVIRCNSDARFDCTDAVVIACWKRSARCNHTSSGASWMLIDRWDFRFLKGEEDRRANLERDCSFEEIVREITTTMTVLCCHNAKCNDGPHGPADVKNVPVFHRPVYCVSVQRPLFDRFFNSRHGYRAAYFRSPFEGLRANDSLMQALAPALRASTPPGDGAELSPDFIRASLMSVSAKAWLAEPNNFCGLCRGEWKSGGVYAQIFNDLWEHGDRSDGRDAPNGTKIKVMGAFLSDELNEFIPSRKRRRMWNIHDRGWS
jgi:hypothetical protein